MDGRRRFSWLLILLLITSLDNSGWVFWNCHGKQSGGRRKLMSRQGFISLDCGIPRHSYYTYNKTGIDYTSDARFIDSGINYGVARDYVNDGIAPYFRNVRSFPYEKRNCYTLPVERNKYLIRAGFWYGNYDGKNQLPIFKLYLGVDEWTTVNISDVSSVFNREIVHIPLTDQIDVCLVNTGIGTPFISVLELRPLNDSIYCPSEPGSLLLFGRWDLGSQRNETILFREEDDVYDRLWRPRASKVFSSVNSSLVSSSLSISDYKLPANVMATASTPVNESAMSMGFSIGIDDDTSQKLYIYMHFAEVRDIVGQTREFTISANNHTTFGPPLTPSKDTSDTRYNKYSISGSTTGNLTISLTRTIRSSFPPLINAIEIYKLKDFSLASTQQGDVNAMKKIKSDYAVSRNWQGDPCLPTDYQWHGLTCSHDTSSPPIISLNLSSSNLSGDILPSFSGLKSLQSLDLSYNNLTGQVPKFFADLPSLTVLDLTGNNLTGSVPRAVLRKFKNGILRLGENPNLCPSESCQGMKEKKTNFLIPILVPILSVIMIMIVITALAMIIRKCKKKEIEATTMEMTTEYRKDGQLKSGNCEFSYFEIRSITDNFSQIIGRGGFGQVYMGTLADSTEVAVKVRSKLSIQGTKELQAETKLLTRVHHKNLVRLVGFCDDGTNMALIYEYMSTGNLQKNLFERDAIVLNWKRRLQIAVDASQGLEYLHNGCKPPIVHRDMKSSNILLNETLQAKISDFGMSRDLATESGTLTSTVPAGTPGYLDPQYQSTGILNKKSDVYSFGIVLLELITGQPAIKKPGGVHIVGWVGHMIGRGDIRSIMDPRLEGDFNTNSAWKAIEIALACVASVGVERPDMSLVVADMKECLEIEMASRRITIDSHNISSGNLLDDCPYVIGNELAPHAR